MVDGADRRRLTSKGWPMAVQSTGPQTGAQAVVQDALDPARRPDVFFRVRRDEGHQVSAWWMIGAFVVVSAGVIALMSLVPGGA
jgi:hypothetical protein